MRYDDQLGLSAWGASSLSINSPAWYTLNLVNLSKLEQSKTWKKHTFNFRATFPKNLVRTFLGLLHFWLNFLVIVFRWRSPLLCKLDHHCYISEGKTKIAYIKIRWIAQLENAERMRCSFYWYLPTIKFNPTGYPGVTTTFPHSIV